MWKLTISRSIVQNFQDDFLRVYSSGPQSPSGQNRLPSQKDAIFLYVMLFGKDEISVKFKVIFGSAKKSSAQKKGIRERVRVERCTILFGRKLILCVITCGERSDIIFPAWTITPRPKTRRPTRFEKNGRGDGNSVRFRDSSDFFFVRNGRFLEERTENGERGGGNWCNFRNGVRGQCFEILLKSRHMPARYIIGSKRQYNNT